jgi:pimeloyl-ACP methyl ester carboxylesterase
MESRAARFANIRLKTGPRLHCAECGNPNGEPVVFLHGWPDSWFSFSRLLPLFPESFRGSPGSFGHIAFGRVNAIGR